MDQLNVSASILWSNARHDLFPADVVLGDVAVVASAPATIQFLGNSEVSFEGGMALVESCCTERNSQMFLLVFTESDMSLARIFMAVQSCDIVAHVEPLEGLRSLALCVDMDGQLRYLVVGPLPTSAMMEACFATGSSAKSESEIADPSTRYPLGYESSVRVDLPRVVDGSSSCVTAEGCRNCRGGSNAGDVVKISVGLLRDKVLSVLSAQRPHLFEFPWNVSKGMMTWLKRREVLEALSPPSLGRAVYLIAGHCTFFASSEAACNATACHASDRRPIGALRGLVAVIRNALVLLPLETNCGTSPGTLVVRWNQLLGYQASDVLKCTRVFHVAMSDGWKKHDRSAFLPCGIWLSIIFPSWSDCNAMEYALRTAYISATGNECRVLERGKNVTVGDAEVWGGVWPPSLKGTTSAKCNFSSTMMMMEPGSAVTTRRNLTRKTELMPPSPKTTTDLVVDCDGRGEACISSAGFVWVLIHQTPSVLLLVDHVACRSMTATAASGGGGGGGRNPSEIADLFIDTFTELRSTPTPGGIVGNGVHISLVHAAICAECTLRRLPPASMEPCLCCGSVTKPVLLSPLSSLAIESHETIENFFPMVMSPMCAVIIVRFIMEHTSEAWDAVCEQVSPAREMAVNFSEHIIPNLLIALDAMPEFPFILTFVFKNFFMRLPPLPHIHDSCEEGSAKSQAAALHLVVQLYFTGLYLHARETYGLGLRTGNLWEAFHSLLKWCGNVIEAVLLGEENDIRSVNVPEETMRRALTVRDPPADHPLRRLESLWIEHAPSMITASLALTAGGGAIDDEAAIHPLADAADAAERGQAKNLQKGPTKPSARQPTEYLSLGPFCMPPASGNEIFFADRKRSLRRGERKQELMNEASVQVCHLSSHADLPPAAAQEGVQHQNQHRCYYPRYGTETVEASVQTVRTSSQEEALLRSHLQLQTKVRYLERVCADQRPTSSATLSMPLAADVSVPFHYLKAYRSHLEHVTALEQRIDELKRLSDERQDELFAVQKENFALKKALCEATSPSGNQPAPFHVAYLMLCKEASQFMMEREEHERDTIIFSECKERTALLFSLLRSFS
ncbi:hypothetical protein Tc00.1047053506251.40 [Trypanosoma cruzi]|uniref:Uncharacterized protein n=1 Tax=Trypanosoma cruzi (strain CL Brener) TaxID=353153 RepID=Q4DH20_TRYCC|nr:hypothetical protein Tc00.1047053506251.40 [Trypanosoma cruzi]EAN91821.1 hypothetical protein Tc00.1047053506251.40 [Trypanosoma cruzi]|eukprot:XP_813672.1 hypothetical protein [Trypanosoma cruzi strain CL Brener]